MIITKIEIMGEITIAKMVGGDNCRQNQYDRNYSERVTVISPAAEEVEGDTPISVEGRVMYDPTLVHTTITGIKLVRSTIVTAMEDGTMTKRSVP